MGVNVGNYDGILRADSKALIAGKLRRDSN